MRRMQCPPVMIFQTDGGVSGAGRRGTVLVSGFWSLAFQRRSSQLEGGTAALCIPLQRATIGTQPLRPTRDRRTGLVQRPPRSATAAATAGADHHSPPRRVCVSSRSCRTVPRYVLPPSLLEIVSSRTHRHLAHQTSLLSSGAVAAVALL